MFMMIKCRPRLVRDSAMCRQSEVLSQIVSSHTDAIHVGAMEIDGTRITLPR